jgi:hypothetical protein
MAGNGVNVEGPGHRGALYQVRDQFVDPRELFMRVALCIFLVIPKAQCEDLVTLSVKVPFKGSRERGSAHTRHGISVAPLCVGLSGVSHYAGRSSSLLRLPFRFCQESGNWCRIEIEHLGARKLSLAEVVEPEDLFVETVPIDRAPTLAP